MSGVAHLQALLCLRVIGGGQDTLPNGLPKGMGVTVATSRYDLLKAYRGDLQKAYTDCPYTDGSLYKAYTVTLYTTYRLFVYRLFS